MDFANCFSPMNLFFWGLISFLSGSIPFGYMTAKIVKGIDIREHGSRNTGATNVGRVIGWKYGIFVLVLDSLKGALPIFFFRSMNLSCRDEFVVSLALVFGFLAVLGHVFSPFTGFRGGKGVATAFGVCLILIPILTLCAVCIFLIIYRFSGYVSVGSVLTSMLMPFLYWLSFWIGIHESYSNTVFYGLVLLAFSILIFHRDNLLRIYQGRELGATGIDSAGKPHDIG